MKTKPAISVLLPVYNAAKYLPACLESILGQTFSDFELIIVEDGSTDESLEIIKSFRDSRIRLLENEVNQGPSASMNRAIAAASGTFIARMDADDIALPQRLEKQYAFFKEHPDYALLGTNMEFFGQRSLLFPLQYYTYFDDESLKLRAFFYTPLAQPSMMVRTAVLQQFPYREDFYTAEDYDLFVRVLATYKATSLEEKLVRYRVHQKNISKLKKTQTLRNLKEVYALKFRLEGVTVSAKDFEAHLLIPPANYSDLSLTDMQR
ncbi:MAG: glycosyltransferase, partial [Bacteroidota bacterium]